MPVYNIVFISDLYCDFFFHLHAFSILHLQINESNHGKFKTLGYSARLFHQSNPSVHPLVSCLEIRFSWHMSKDI